MTEPLQPLLTARGLHLRHPRSDRDAVRDLHLELRQGEILVILGPNGSGKSTALAGLARGLRPRAGDVSLGAHPAWGLSRRAFARRVARLPQEPACPDGLTVEELVTGGRHPYANLLGDLRPADRAAVREALRWLDLEDLRGRAVARLSGGERRRAWLAMTLCQGADVLLLDEPTASLDLKHQCEVLELLARINRERGVTLGIVLHDVDQAARLAHRVAILHRGRLYRAGPPRDCLTREMFLDVYGVETRITDEAGALRVQVLGPGDPTRSL
ncbi:MAG TPA: ABC transporter ATP-binding protein [Thermoanaerobaculia bacterium]|nr:ABC transporter ATP-binding protein [Thermoanaerobaculia bacterium]